MNSMQLQPHVTVVKMEENQNFNSRAREFFFVKQKHDWLVIMQKE